MFDAVIFDFDGVIADTEPLHYQAFREVLAAHGVDLSETDYFAKYVGLNDATFIRRIFEDRRKPLPDPQEIRSRKDADYESLIARGLPLLPGVRSFVETAARSVPLAICSGARRSEIISLLRQHELEQFFSAIVATEDVPISKPDPAGFLRALELLRKQKTDLTADRCLVIEDSLLGIRAARAAGMPVLAVLGPIDHPSRTKADQRTSEAGMSCKNLNDARAMELVS